MKRPKLGQIGIIGKQTAEPAYIVIGTASGEDGMIGGQVEQLLSRHGGYGGRERTSPENWAGRPFYVLEKNFKSYGVFGKS